MCKQGDMSISAYFTQLKGLWQELDNFRPIPLCFCATRCTWTIIPTIQTYRDNDHVIRFLRGLNEQYSHVKSQIMLMKPLPDINEAFSLLCQQERELGGPVKEPQILFNSTEDRNQNWNRNNRGRGGRNGSGSRGNSGRTSKMCTYCNRNGHTIDTCYKKHGFPPNYKRNSAVNNCTAPRDSFSDDDVHTVVSHREEPESSGPGFTPEQHKGLLALLQGSQNHSTNQITTYPVIPKLSGHDNFEDDWCS